MIKHPGKFERELYATRYIHETADGSDEIGSCDELGWYCRFEGKIKARGPFYAIVSENSQGFVHGEYFDTLAELDKAWEQVDSAYSDYYEECEREQE